MSENRTGLDLAMLKHQLTQEIVVQELLGRKEVRPLLEESVRAISMLEIAIGAHAQAMTQIQELIAEVQYLKAVNRG